MRGITVLSCLILSLKFLSIQGDGLVNAEDDDSFFGPGLIAGTLVCFLGGALGGAAGIGGGGLFVPTFILGLGLTAHHAIPLSKVTVLGVAIGSFIVNVWKRHPKTDRPLIDYDTAVVLEPMTLVGSILGVVLNIFLPASVITVILVIFLFLIAGRTFQKARKQHEIEKTKLGKGLGESQEIELTKNEADTDNFISSGDHSINEKEIEINTDDEDDEVGFGIANASPAPVEFQRIMFMTEQRTIPVKNVLFLVTILIILLVVVYSKALVACGSALYWFFLVILPATVMFTASFFGGKRILRRHVQKVACEFNFVEGDVRWTKKRLLSYSGVAVIAGVCAGLLGVGGGMVKGPLMVEMGILPSIAAATSTFMILFTATSTSVQYMLLGRLDLLEGLWYAGVGFFAAICGNLALKKVLQSHQKQSYVTFLLAFAIFVSSIAMGAVFIQDLVKGEHDTDFGSLCNT